MRRGFRLRSVSILLVALGACTSTEPSDDNGGTQPDFSTPSAIVKASGDGQVIPSGGAPSPLKATVFTPTGHKCYGCTVTWTLSPGQFQGGSVIATTSGIGESGLNLTGFQAGAYTVTATIANGSSVAFSITFQ